MGRSNYAIQGICQGPELWKIKGDVMVAGVTALILSQDSLSLFLIESENWKAVMWQPPITKQDTSN